MKTTKPLLFLVLFVLFQLQHSAEGFDDRAHTSLSGRAAQVSGLDNYLQVNLTFEFPLAPTTAFAPYT